MMAKGLMAKSDNAGTKKSPLQIQMLEGFYSEVQYPKPEDMTEYAASVGLTYSQVRIWFKERRRKERRHMEAAGVHMETQVSAGSTRLSCSSSRSMSLVGEKHTLRSQVLFPKDYILRKVFRKDGPSLGSEFDPLPQRAHGHVRASQRDADKYKALLADLNRAAWKVAESAFGGLDPKSDIIEHLENVLDAVMRSQKEHLEAGARATLLSIKSHHSNIDLNEVTVEVIEGTRPEDIEEWNKDCKIPAQKIVARIKFPLVREIPK